MKNSTAPDSPPLTPPDPLYVFETRCAVRAQRWQAGELELHEGVDELQWHAEQYGLVDKLGQDEVQRIIAEAFRRMQ